ncbi:MAG: excinuclease ABC subunit UvrC [Clostridiales bacterium]|nr:excinuclease ABC subunit UvrC [Clostridiales bacterium]
MDQERIGRLRKKARELPLLPGVYFMKDARGKVIYVGKAKALRNRVGSYFTGIESHPPKVFRMVALVQDFDTIVTATELEALVLECAQIKHHMPHYNILLKDDKAYPYIKLDIASPYPRLAMVRRRERDDALYFGPYSGRVGEMIATVNKTFLLPSCSRVFPRDIGKARPCLNASIKTCMAPCSGQVSEAQYREAVGDAIAFLEGRYSTMIEELEQRMAQAAEEMRFEEAARIRDRLKALTRLRERQKVVDAPNVSQDVIGYAEQGRAVAVAVMTVRQGRLISLDSFRFGKEEFEPPEAGLAAFIKQHYLQSADLPRDILLSLLPEDDGLLEQYLSERAGHRVHLRRPQRGALRRKVEMAEVNAAQLLEQHSSQEEKLRRSVEELQALLGLERPPLRIEAVDISNTAGSESVGGMVTFVNGRPSKKDYKRYKIKSVEGQDDYESMREVIWRRMRRFRQGEEGFEQLPDLLLLDGGRGHLSAVQEVLRELGVDIPVFAMVKDEHHRTRGLVGEGGEITPTPVSPAAVLVGKIQEEVHRYAIDYHRRLRGKKTFSSQLTGIEGIGEKRAAALMAHFKTIERIQKATEQELCAVPGMSRAAAAAIRSHFGQV